MARYRLSAAVELKDSLAAVASPLSTSAPEAASFCSCWAMLR